MNFLKNRLGVIPLSCIVATTLSVLGCGGEEENAESDAPYISGATLSAQNATFSTGYAESFEIDLSSSVFSSTDGGFALSEIEVLSNNESCQVESWTETEFVIQASDTKVCYYRYHVTPKTLSSMNRMAEAPTLMSDNSTSEDSSSAVVRISVSSDPTSTELTPVSATTLINEDVSISLKAELDKVGITLGDEFVLTELILPYARSSSAQINDTDDQVLDYTPPQDFTGVDRVLYTLEDSVNGLVLMGVVDIAVGYQVNQGFTNDDHIVYPDIVNVLTNEEIDISDFVVSEDGDDFQLVYVSSFDASVSAKNPMDINNKTIVFNTSRPGSHYISFGVSDHYGAYGVGVILVNVIDPTQQTKWGDISHLLDIYTGPLTKLDAISNNISYDTVLYDYDYNPVIEMAGFNYLGAEAYCKDILGASLPTVEQLKVMTADNNVHFYDKWPVQAKYLAFDDVASEPMLVDLTDDNFNIDDVDPTSAYYVTCVKQGVFNVLPKSSTQVVADGVDVGYVYVELKRDKDLAPEVLVTGSVDSTNVTLESDTVTTNIDGIAEFRLTSFKAETVTLTIDIAGVTEDYEVKFIADEKTAEVSSEVTFDGTGSQVILTLMDQNGNPLEGYSIDSKVSTVLHPDTGNSVTPIVEAETTQTDESGVQKIRVKWDNIPFPTSDMIFDVTSSYTRTNNTETSHISQVTLWSGLCGGQVGDDDPQNASGSCLKVVENDRMLFTSAPSIDFMNRFNLPIFADSGDKETNVPGIYATHTFEEGDVYCEKLNFLNRQNWRIAEATELEGLWSKYGNMSEEKGWPATLIYRSYTLYNASATLAVDLQSGNSTPVYRTNTHYISCVSDY
ncbi:hypothetical protein AKJ18_22315 [Vibrio xuii]|nr:hypothetical protein AKJ18_22315 [Vibrio xuii]